MAVLSAKARKAIRPGNFALPGGGYPIENVAHARAALSLGAQHASPAQYAKIKAAVKRKYPSMNVGGMKKGK